MIFISCTLSGGFYLVLTKLFFIAFIVLHKNVVFMLMKLFLLSLLHIDKWQYLLHIDKRQYLLHIDKWQYLLHIDKWQ